MHVLLCVGGTCKGKVWSDLGFRVLRQHSLDCYVKCVCVDVEVQGPVHSNQNWCSLVLIFDGLIRCLAASVESNGLLILVSLEMGPTMAA